jgi:hypothetical protein
MIAERSSAEVAHIDHSQLAIQTDRERSRVVLRRNMVHHTMAAVWLPGETRIICRMRRQKPEIVIDRSVKIGSAAVSIGANRSSFAV